MKQANDKLHESGRISFFQGVVEYIIPDEPVSYRQNWTLPLSEIRLIGEYTNSDGPHLDDYFFVFVLADGSWRQASFYAVGREAFLLALGKEIGSELECGLCSSTKLKSRILWPEGLCGQTLFTFARSPKSKNLFCRLVQKLSPTFLFELSEPVKKLLHL